MAQIPAIMLTAHGSEQSEVSCLQAGADDFVTKPVNASVLRARIETQLRLRLMRRQLEQQNDELEKWRRDLERDLAAARLTQQSLIPQKPLLLPGWQIATCYRPVIQVGGDIYGWLRMKDGRVLFWIADGTGHGAAAALLTTLAKLLFHHGSMDHDSPATLMEGVDNDFRSIFGATSFMTAMCVALDPATGQRLRSLAQGTRRSWSFATTAQRNPSPRSRLRWALIKRTAFTETAIDLEPGDAFLLYTDGLFRWTKDERHRVTPGSSSKFWIIPRPPRRRCSNESWREQLPENSAKTAPDDLAAIVVRREDRQ